MDQVGLPIDKAWTLYQPFIVRRLVRRGMSKIKAMESVKDRTEPAMRELQGEMKDRPIVINRAPVLHRFGVMALWPQLTSSNTLEIPPLVTGGFNADFDGDAMQFHLPSTPEAVEEAKEKLMPSRNLFSVSDFGAAYTPTMEYVGGLWAATTKRDKKKPVRVFNTTKDAIHAYKRGDIGVGQRVEIREGR
jgi:DNA-directed RNA polymerase subunit beta'